MINPLLIPRYTVRALVQSTVFVAAGILTPLVVQGQLPGRFTNQPTPQVTNSGTPTATSQTALAAPAARRPQGKLVLIPPGTVIGKEAPKGWSHLILKTLPRILPEHQNRVSASTLRLSTLVFSSIAAKVHLDPATKQYTLGDIGLGLGVKAGDSHVVLSPKTQGQFANLGFLERNVLSECYKKQALARGVVRTDTMAIFDTHAVMVRDRQHRVSKMRYAVLLDPRSGRIATLAWGVDLDQQSRPVYANSSLEWLPANKVDDCILHIDPRQITLGIPNDRTFAVNRPPQGHSRIALTRELSIQAGKPTYTTAEAAQLEQSLRTELGRLIQAVNRAPSAN